MSVRLRYLAHDLEVPPGEFVIGRSAECQLSLDDPLVSRRHALLVVRADGVYMEDLHSRNGVLINGKRLEGTSRLSDGDQITVGSQVMTLVGVPGPVSGATQVVRDSKKSAPSADSTTLPGIEDQPGADERPSIVAAPQRAKGDAAPATKDAAALDARDAKGDESAAATAENQARPTPLPGSPDKRVNAFALIGGLAEKAFAMNRSEEAQRILSRSLQDILLKARARQPISQELAEKASHYAVRLAHAAGRGVWIDYVFELYTLLAYAIPPEHLKELDGAIRKISLTETSRQLIEGYIALLQRQKSTLGPNERFVLQRVESLLVLVKNKSPSPK